MKKIITPVLILIALSIASCKKYLSIEPKQTLADVLFVSDLKGLQTTTIGAFHQLQSDNLYGGGIIANNELMADYISTNAISDFSLSQLRSHQFNAYNGQAGGMWGDAYHAILIANTVLKYLPNYRSQDSATADMLKGECLFIRAAMHYELVRMFAQPAGFTSDNSHEGIPIRLIPGSATEGLNTPRSTVAQVYTQIISDLKQAEPLLPATTSALGPNYVSKYAVEAFLAKAYFAQNDYNNANTYADLVISGGFSLNSNIALIDSVSEVGLTTTSETVFEIINTTTNISNGSIHGRFGQPPFGSTVPLYMMSTTCINNILTPAKNTGDLRYNAFFRKAFGVYICKKYNGQYLNLPIVRLAEMLLTRAECNAQLGNSAAAQADVNLVRRRAGLAPNYSNTGATLISFIQSERDIELAMEGDHFNEVKRRKGTFYTPNAGTLQWNDPTMIYPIPAQEVNENKSMVQNPGY